MRVFIAVGIGAGDDIPSYAVNEGSDGGIRGVVRQQVVDDVDAGSWGNPLTCVNAWMDAITNFDASII